MNQFDSRAAQWDQKTRRRMMAVGIADCIKANVTLEKNMAAMDFGCGTGLVTMELAGQVESITAVDNSRGMIEVLQQKIQDLGMSNVFPVLVDSYKEIPANNGYDLIVSSMVMHHIEDYQAVLRHFYDLLNPGGMIAISDLQQEDGTFHSLDAQVVHHGFDIAQFRSVLKGIGFVGIEDRIAYTVERAGNDGIEREYPVFLITARLPR